MRGDTALLIVVLVLAAVGMAASFLIEPVF